MRGIASLLQVGAMIVAAGLMCLSPQIEQPQFAAKTCDNPLCTCQACDCEVCACTPLQTFEPLTELAVGLPPDTMHLTSGKIVPVSMPATEPAPSPQPSPQVKPVVKASAPTGRWVTQYAGFRGRRSYQVWVPDQPAVSANGSCANGSCSTAAGPAYSSGSCQVQQYTSTGGGCASCGRGRR